MAIILMKEGKEESGEKHTIHVQEMYDILQVIVKLRNDWGID